MMVRGCRITTLTPITDQKDSEKVWRMYLKEIKDEDTRMTDTWKQDAKDVLVFVSPNQPISLFVTVRLNDKPQDRSFLCNCCRIYH